MFQHIYRLLIEPHSSDPDHRNREVVLNWLFAGLICLLIVFSLSSLKSVVVLGKTYTIIAFFIINSMLALAILYSCFWRKKEYAQRIAANALILFLYLAATFLVFQWGLVNIYGILLYCLVIIISGILVSSRYSLYAVGLIAITLGIYEFARSHAFIAPNISPSVLRTSGAEIINFSTMFLIIALVSWLFNRQMEQSLQRARLSELELKKERDSLEIKVEERTRALHEAQLEKVQQFYRFAELGHLSTALFHDLAGSLSSLSIDIESLRKKGRADFTKRIDSNIHYIDGVVQRVKSQIQGKDTVETFDVVAETKDLVGILSYNARKARSKIELRLADPRQIILFTGNLTRFRQLIINLLSNAIEAYPPATSESVVKDRPVIIELAQDELSVIIQVTDHGKGIHKDTQAKIFDPFYTTKSTGSGIGLFIVKQVAEKDFSGKIQLHSTKKTGTTFTITLPKK